VLFDLDDTLIDHRGASRDALRRWASGRGLEWSHPDLEARWIHLEKTHYSRYQLGLLTKQQQRRERVRAMLAPVDLTDHEADQAFAEYWQAYCDGWRPFTDAIPAIQRALAAGLIVGVLTNGDHSDQSKKLQGTGLDRLWLPLFASSELPAAKPDPRAFDAACAAMGVEPARCVMVGDSVENDIEGARHAGMPAILVDRHGRHPSVRVRSVSSLDELRFGSGCS